MKKTLNSKFWNTNKELDPEVRKNLIQLAKDFIENLKVSKLKLVDIRFTGSLANYNWHDKSDIDLHLIFDLSNFDKHKDFIIELLQSKKTVWNLKHTVLMHGHPVEIYGEDVKAEHSSTGVFSLVKNEWLKEPKEKDENEEVDKKKVMRKYRDKVDEILYLEERADKETDKTKLIKDMENFVIKLRDSRNEALKKDGEMTVENIVFKMLRKNDFIDRLIALKNKLYDKNLTVEKVIDIESELKT